jgi:tetratricopeptide (TPR) repeat protein
MYAAFQEAHHRAVELAGLTPEMRSDRGHGLHLFERRFGDAEADLLCAQREKPRAATAVRLTMLYAALGRMDDALGVLKDGGAIEPLWPMLPAAEINIRFLRREFECAVACGKEALELHPYLQMARLFLAQALEYSGNVEEALGQYQRACALSGDLPWLRALEATCLARHGSQAEACEILRELEQIRAADYVDGYYMALLYDALGDRDQAFRELERAIADRSGTVTILAIDPKMDCLRRDARFNRLCDTVFAGVRSMSCASGV